MFTHVKEREREQIYKVFPIFSAIPRTVSSRAHLSFPFSAFSLPFRPFIFASCINNNQLKLRRMDTFRPGDQQMFDYSNHKRTRLCYNSRIEIHPNWNFLFSMWNVNLLQSFLIISFLLSFAFTFLFFFFHTIVECVQRLMNFLQQKKTISSSKDFNDTNRAFRLTLRAENKKGLVVFRQMFVLHEIEMKGNISMF